MLLSVMNNQETFIVDASSAPLKPERVPLAELKNGKAFIRQKAVSFEKMSETMQEIVTFRQMLEQRIQAQSPPLEHVPDEHLPLIAKLVHESDKTITALVKHVRHALRPVELDAPSIGDETLSAPNDQLTLPAIEAAITSIADRNNYGVDLLGKVPAALCVWRWEVKEHRRDLLPKIGRDAVEARIAERHQAKRDLTAFFEALTQDDKDALLKGVRKDKGKMRAVTNADLTSVLPGKNEEVENEQDLQGCIAPQTSQVQPATEKSVDAERTVKSQERERAERKAAKAEKERKEKETQKKSRTLLSAFLTKPKQTKVPKTLKISAPSAAASNQTASTSQSDFSRAFRPFVLKKDATLAPVNRFMERAKSVIILDDDQRSDGRAMDIQADPSFIDMKTQDLLALNTKALYAAGPSDTIHRQRASQYKSSSAYSVRTVVAQLTEAEVSGDTALVRTLTDLLSSRCVIPAKVFIFHDDTRPGYFGTFTRSSTVVGPRCPLQKDAVALDYSYDSGAEWEEEEEGADDLMSIGGSAEEEDGDADSDLDDWLIDDDEVEVDPGTPLSDRAGSPDLVALPAPKRKQAANNVARDTKKRKVVVPLVPFTKGPCWENNIGVPEYEPFKSYRIQLFNDTPFPVDPFTFVSSPPTEERAALSTAKFVVPALPAHVLNAHPQSASVSEGPCSDAVSHSGLATTPPGPKRKAAPMQVPKTPFPDVYLPALLTKIASLSTGNLTFIVESVYQDLRAHKDAKVKKNAVEAKVREVCEKCKIKKVWVVKDEFLTSHGNAVQS